MTISTDCLIVGAGPVGLFQVFELGLLGIHAQVVDSMEQIGGQCIELYPDKPIYDIPAVPVCTGRELIARLVEQIRPFQAEFHLGQEVQLLRRAAAGAFEVETSVGTRFLARTVIIAGGVGAFRPRELAVPGAAERVGRRIHYRIRQPEQFHGKDLIVAGGGDAALDWALELYDKARSLVLVHRSNDFRAAPARVAEMRARCEALEMQFEVGEFIAIEGDEPQSAALLRTPSGLTRRIDFDHLLVCWGLHPKLGPIAEWGLALHKQQIEVDTARFATNVPGIYAVGDINHYPGKKKLILSGFHEAALAAFAVREYVRPGEKVHLQYTTTSPALHRRLGVATDPEFVVQRAA